MKSNDILQTRRYARQDGNFRIVNVSARVWQVFDWLIEEYSYPVEELIADTEDIFGEEEFDTNFAKGIMLAYEAQVMARDGLANDNFSDAIA